MKLTSIKHQVGNEDLLLVCFSSAGVPQGKFNYTGLFRDVSFGVLYINSANSDDWFLGGVPELSSFDKTVDYINRVIKEFKYKKVVTFGSSMGGFASVAYGCALKANAIHAFCCDYDLSLPYVRGYSAFKRFRNSHFNLKEMINSYSGIVNLYFGVYDFRDMIASSFFASHANVKQAFFSSGHGLDLMLDCIGGPNNLIGLLSGFKQLKDFNVNSLKVSEVFSVLSLLRNYSSSREVFFEWASRCDHPLVNVFCALEKEKIKDFRAAYKLWLSAKKWSDYKFVSIRASICAVKASLFSEALSIISNIDNESLRAYDHYDLSKVHLALGNSDTSFYHSDYAVKLAKRSNILINHANVLSSLNLPMSALSYAIESLLYPPYSHHRKNLLFAMKQALQLHDVDQAQRILDIGFSKNIITDKLIGIYCAILKENSSKAKQIRVLEGVLLSFANEIIYKSLANLNFESGNMERSLFYFKKITSFKEKDAIRLAMSSLSQKEEHGFAYSVLEAMYQDGTYTTDTFLEVFHELGKYGSEHALQAV